MIISLPPSDGPFDAQALGELRVWAIALGGTQPDKFTLTPDEQTTVREFCTDKSKAVHPEVTVGIISDRAKSWVTVERSFKQTTVDLLTFARASLAVVQKAPTLKDAECVVALQALRSSTEEYQKRADTCAKQLSRYRKDLATSQNDLAEIQADLGKAIDQICQRGGPGTRSALDAVEAEIEKLNNELTKLAEEMREGAKRAAFFCAFGAFFPPLQIGAAVEENKVGAKILAALAKRHSLEENQGKAARYTLARASLKAHGDDIAALCGKIEVAERATSSLAATWGRITQELSGLLEAGGGLSLFETLPSVFGPKEAYEQIRRNADDLLKVLALEPVMAAA